MSKPTQRAIVTKRAADTSSVDAAETTLDKINALNKLVQELPFSHNEVRRLVPKLLDLIVQQLNPAPVAKEDISNG